MMSSSMSVAADALQTELHQVVGLGGGGSGPVEQVIVQRRERGAVDDDGIVARARPAVQRHDGRREEVDEEVDRRLLLAGVRLGQAIPVGDEGPGATSGAGVARLGEHPLDPRPHPGLGRVDPLHPALEGGEEPSSAVVEQEEEQLVLGLEVPVEGLGGEAGLGQDLPQRRVDVAGALDEVVRGLEHALDLVGVLRAPVPERTIDRPLGQGSPQVFRHSAAPVHPDHCSVTVRTVLCQTGDRGEQGGCMERELVLTGIGGQGVQLAAQVLARAAIAEGRSAQMFGSYGGMMRGGNTEATLVIADGAIGAPPTVADTWSAIFMHHDFSEPTRAKLRPGSLVLVNTTVFEGSFDR